MDPNLLQEHLRACDSYLFVKEMFLNKLEHLMHD